MQVRYTYRLRPSRQTKQNLLNEWHANRYIWNHCVSTTNPEKLGSQLTTLREQHEWLRECSVVPQQATIRKYQQAEKQANKGTRGDPKFKSVRTDQPSLDYSVRGFNLKNNKLNLAKGITIPIVWSRDLPSEPKSVVVYRDKTHKWWASFVVEIEPENVPTTGTIGIDFGVTVTASTTTPKYNKHHQHHQTILQSKIDNAKKKMDRKVKKSRKHLKATLDHARLYQKLVWKRKDDAYKWSNNIVKNHQEIAVEDFSPAFIAKTSMSKVSADGSPSMLKNTLCHVATKHGRDIVLVNPAFTSQDCCKCGSRAKIRLQLSDRIYNCHCGLSIDRDLNAAFNMVARAGFNPAGIPGFP